MNIEIRQAEPSEAQTLTAIAHAAKRHWGYPEKWVQQWEPDLTITRDFISDNEVFVAVAGEEIAGCCALVLNGSLAEIEHMWIKPEHMGSGVGRALFNYARQRAEERGALVLELSADPNAEGFYERMGTTRVGEVTADMDGNPRVLPRMRMNL